MFPECLNKSETTPETRRARQSGILEEKSSGTQNQTSARSQARGGLGDAGLEFCCAWGEMLELDDHMFAQL